MAFHIGARGSALASLLLVGACAGSGSTGSKIDPGVSNGTDDGSQGGDHGNGSGGPGAMPGAVAVTHLASDQPGAASNVQSTLINAWGIAAFQGSFWIANEGTGKLSILDGAGAPVTGGKVVSDAIDLGEGITGIATNDSTAMQIDVGAACGPASLIVASVHGQLFGVNPDLAADKGFVLVDRSDVGASYTGVATLHGIQGSGGDQRAGGGILALAADFHNARIDVFDENFQLVTAPMFTAPEVPAGFAPFNVWAWDGTVYVSYAQQDEAKAEEVTGPGLGFVVAFDASGTVKWMAKGDELDAPWGMTLGGDLMTGALLVGNFGDGHITAIDPATGMLIGQLEDDQGAAIAIDGLWGIALGTGVANARAGALYFAAGPDDEMHGMFGLIALATTTTPPPTEPTPPTM